jgi:hypothetical protein
MYRMHMSPNDAVLAHQALHSQHSIAIHFGLLDLAKAHAVEDTAFIAPRIGEAFQY